MKRNTLFCMILLVFCFAEVRGQSVSSQKILAVDEAVEIALKTNLSLQRSALETAEKKRASDRSWNSLLPSLGVSTGISYPTSVTGSLSPAQKVLTPGLSLSASLNVSTAVIENIKKAGADYEAGLLNHEMAAQELELQVRKIFYQILLLQANKELVSQSLESARARYEESAALVKVGQASRLDELSARVDLENQRPQVRSAETLYANTLDSFKAILGIPQETELLLQGDLEYDGGVVAGETLHSSPDTSLETAVLRQGIKALEAQRKAAWHGAYIPALRFSWNANPLYRDEAWNDSGSFSISLGVNLDSFLPWSTVKTQLDALDDSIQSSQLQLAESLRSREDRIRQYQRTINQTIEAIEVLKLNVELAESTYQMYGEAYRRGTADYQSLRNAGDSLLQAQYQVQQEYYNLIAAVLDMDKELNRAFTF
ncbi:MAG: TolC family protein [Spirochaetaceae bacterium]|jgi:outer membrane protein TolC|nr:TolC family protein [Spirochaetaceae bacterium]